MLLMSSSARLLTGCHATYLSMASPTSPSLEYGTMSEGWGPIAEGHVIVPRFFAIVSMGQV
jgi:hypothetical protein